MKKRVLLILYLYCSIMYSQNAGDILFTAFNADGDKDFSIVLMVDLQPNTIIYFTDNEPNAIGNGNNGSEGVLKWDTGSEVLKAGDIVVFTDVDSNSNINFGSSIGELTVTDAGFNISASGDVVYATYGDPSTNSVTTWICGLQNSNLAVEVYFDKTDLSLSKNYVLLDQTASKDGGAYAGDRVNKTLEECIDLLVNKNNWTTHTSDGESLLPFNQTSFEFSTLSQLVLTDNQNQTFQIINRSIVFNQGNIIGIYDVLGRKKLNKDLQSGVYFCHLLLKGNIYLVKVCI